MEGKPSSGTDPRGCSTGHCRGAGAFHWDWGWVSAGLAGAGGDGAGRSQPAAGRESPTSAGVPRRQANLPFQGRAPTEQRCVPRAPGDPGRKAEGQCPGGRGGSLRGCCRNVPRLARRKSGIGGSRGSRRGTRLRLCPPRSPLRTAPRAGLGGHRRAGDAGSHWG